MPDQTEGKVLPTVEDGSQLGGATSESDEEGGPAASGPEEVSEGVPPPKGPAKPWCIPQVASAMDRALAYAESNNSDVADISQKYKFEVGDEHYNAAISRGETAAKKLVVTPAADTSDNKKSKGKATLTMDDLQGRNVEALTAMLPDFAGNDKDSALIRKRIDQLEAARKRVADTIAAFAELVSDLTLGDALGMISKMEAEDNSIKKKQEAHPTEHSASRTQKREELAEIMAACKPMLDKVVIGSKMLWKGGGKDGQKSPKQRLFVLVKDLPEVGSRSLRYFDAKKLGSKAGKTSELGRIYLTAEGCSVQRTEFNDKTQRHTLELVAADKKHGARSFFLSHSEEADRDDWYYQLKEIVGLTIQPSAGTKSGWEIGTKVDIETEDGWELGATILGPAASGDETEMSVRFADGVIDDWDVVEFVAAGGHGTDSLPPSPSSPLSDCLSASLLQRPKNWGRTRQQPGKTTMILSRLRQRLQIMNSIDVNAIPTACGRYAVLEPVLPTV